MKSNILVSSSNSGVNENKSEREKERNGWDCGSRRTRILPRNLKKIHILLFLVCLLGLSACSQQARFNERIVSSAFIGTPKHTLVSCLGSPASEKHVHKKDYLTYIGENNCRTIFVIDKEHVSNVLYAMPNGKRIAPEACQLLYPQCINHMSD
jgi:hypothetical protein